MQVCYKTFAVILIINEVVYLLNIEMKQSITNFLCVSAKPFRETQPFEWRLVEIVKLAWLAASVTNHECLRWSRAILDYSLFALLLLYLLLIIFVFFHVLGLRVHLCNRCVSGAHSGYWVPGIELPVVTNYHEGAGNWTWTPEEQPLLLTAEPSLQNQYICIWLAHLRL